MPARSLGFLAYPLLAATLLSQVGRTAAPVIDPPIPQTGEPARVEAKIPVGKTLLFPVTGSDADGDAISYKATSSNPNILVRVKTGNPKLVLNINHAAGVGADPGYSGTMEFMLFRDWLPVSAGFVAGMAQAGFYDSVIFHRIADLGGGSGTTGYIFQGGDPLGSGSGGPGMTDNEPSSAWKFQNEFHNGTIFSGRGQLAMANAGTNTGYSLGQNGTLIVPDYRDSNGSQFFITDGQPRHLDFKHNIFGQMLRGWDLLPKMRSTPATSSSKPDKDVTITSAKVEPNETDCVLVLSAKMRGTAIITITATDATGKVTKTKFPVQAVKDTSNCNAFLRRMDGISAPKDLPAVFGLDAVDLEFDYLDVQHSMLPQSASIGPKGSLLVSSGRIVQMQPNAGYTGLNNLGFSIRQFDIGGGGFGPISDYTNAYVASGEATARGEGVNLPAQPGLAFTNVVVAKLHDADPAGSPGNFTARINWGDGTALGTGTLARDTSKPGATLFNVFGGHTYVRPGVYPIVVELTGNNGARVTARSYALVSAAPLRAEGGGISANTGKIVNRVIATFTDSNPARPAGYTARIDWGDGLSSMGVISRDASTGKFVVRGSHGYKDSEAFAVSVRIHKKHAPPSSDAFAWTVIEPVFTAPPHLPPFPHPKLTIAWNNGPAKQFRGSPGPNYQVTYSGVFVIINTGNRELKASKIRFWLSDDPVLHKSGANVDRVVMVNGQPELNIIPFPPGAGGSGNFLLTMPRGQSTGRKFLLSEAEYYDPIANDDGSEKVIVTGPLPPTIIVSPVSGLQTTESGETAVFSVVLDTPPSTTSVPISSITAGGPATIDTSTAHGVTSGNEVLITGVTGGSPDINGVHVATAIDTDTITIPVSVTSAGTGGKIQVNPKVTIPVESSLKTEGTPSAGVAIASITQGAPTTGTTPHANTEIDTVTPHGFAQGDEVIFSSVATNVPTLNGNSYNVVVVDEDTFTIPVELVTGGTGGRVQKTRSQVVFDATNWNQPQTVTVTGVDDANLDGDKIYLIQLKAALSADTLFNGVIPGDVVVRNKDNEVTPNSP